MIGTLFTSNCPEVFTILEHCILLLILFNIDFPPDAYVNWSKIKNEWRYKFSYNSKKGGNTDGFKDVAGWFEDGNCTAS